jgi:hypothetical protein
MPESDTTDQPTDQPRPAPPPAGYLTGLVAAIITSADRARDAVGHPRASGPPLQVLPQVEYLLRLAAGMVDLLGPYTRRCELARTAFGAGTDWTICGPDLRAGQFHLVATTGDVVGCVEHLAAARARDLGTIEDSDLRRRIDGRLHRAGDGVNPGQVAWQRYHAAVAGLTTPVLQAEPGGGGPTSGDTE